MDIGWHVGHSLGSVLALRQPYNLREATADPHYLQIPYLWIRLRTGIYLLPNQLLWCFCSHSGTWRKVSVAPWACALWSSNKVAPLCLPVSALLLQTSVMFPVYLLPGFSHFYTFRLWFSCLQLASSTVIEYCPVSWSARKLCCAFWRKCAC